MGVPYAEVIGDPISQSKSPTIHGFWLKALGLTWEYRATRVLRSALPAYLAARRGDPDWRGCNITMPLKEEVIPLLDRLDASAASVKAVNLVVPGPDGMLVGHNTDLPGFLATLTIVPRLPPGQHVATYFHLIGAGGAARAVAAALSGADIVYFNRTPAKAQALADEFGAGSAYGFGQGLEALGGGAVDDFDPAFPEVRPNRGADQLYSFVIINASSMGMAGQPEVPIGLETYPDNTAVYDLVTHPIETPLLRAARARGFATVDGLVMLVEQAALGFELFFGQPAPREGDAQLRELLTS